MPSILITEEEGVSDGMNRLKFVMLGTRNFFTHNLRFTEISVIGLESDEKTSYL